MKRHSTAARLACGTAYLLALISFGGCHDRTQDASNENFTGTINDFLAKRGHLCVAKYNWPIYVTTDDQAAGSRDALQMPVLEKLGLVTASNVVVERKDENGNRISANARQYDLTAAGQKYYLHIPEVVATSTTRVTHPADFCAATLTLDKVVGWEKPITQNGQTVTSVLYTYKIDPAPWANDPTVRHVFPMVARVIEGAGTMQLREGVHLTPRGWVADEVFQR